MENKFIENENFRSIRRTKKQGNSLDNGLTKETNSQNQDFNKIFKMKAVTALQVLYLRVMLLCKTKGSIKSCIK